MNQYAPDPVELFDLVKHCHYRPGWTIELIEMKSKTAGGLTLRVGIRGIYNSYKPIDVGPTYGVYHLRPVPAHTYNRATWMRWLFDQLALIELHECMEWFKIDDERPFSPTHGPGEDPYTVHEIATARQAATNYRGDVTEADVDAKKINTKSRTSKALTKKSLPKKAKLD